MRRFIAYLLACITIFLGIGVAFKPVVTKINADLNYRDGKELTFLLTNRTDSKNEEDKAIDDEDVDASKNFAKIMENRLVSYGVTDYNITTKGNDVITVKLTADNETEYTNISNLLSVNSSLTLACAKDDALPVSDEEGLFSWHDSKATVEYDGLVSVLVMGIPENARDKVKEMYEQAKKDEGGSEEEHQHEEGEEHEHEEETKESIVVWLDRNEEKFENRSSDENVSKKILTVLNTENFYYGDGEDKFQIRFTPSSASSADVRNAYRQAFLHMNLLNASTTDYDCRCIRSEIAPATVENLLLYSSTVSISMSSTFIAFIIATIILLLLLALFYRATSLAIASSTALTTFLTLTLFTIFNPLFNIGAITGLIITIGGSLFVGIAHSHYIRTEVYKGRSLKKANFEAGKKCTILALDVSIIFILFGIILYFIGGTTVGSLGVVLIIAAVINILVNTFILKGLMWLITNTSAFADKFNVFNIDAKKVPNLAKEEKPFYLGAYQNRNLAKNRKAFGFICGGLIVACIVGIAVFGANNISMFNTGSYFNKTNEIHFTIERSEANTVEPITDFTDFKSETLDKITNNSNVLKYNPEIQNFSYKIYDSDSKITNNFYSYYITLNEANVESETYSFNNGKKQNLIDAFKESLETYSAGSLSSSNPKIHVSQVYSLPSNTNLIFAAIIVSTVVCGVYLWLRYRASRAIGITLIALTGIILTFGILTLTRMSALPIFAICGAFTSIFALLFGIYIAHQDKDLIRDERVRDSKTRSEVLNKSLVLALSPAVVFALLVVYLGVNFFGFGSAAYGPLFLASAIAVALVILIYMKFFTPVVNAIDAKLINVKLPEIKHKSVKKNITKSNVPQEAIFIGIND